MHEQNGSGGVTIRTVKCQCYGEYLKIEPAIHGMIPPIKTRQAKLVTSSKRGAEIQLSGSALCPHPTIQSSLVKSGRQGDHEFTTTYVGLAPVVRQQCKDAGIGGALYPRQAAELPPPDWDRLAAVNAVDRQFVEFVRDVDRGLVLHGASVDPGLLIAQVGLAYPSASIAVPLITRDRAYRVAVSVQSLLPEAVCFVRHGVESYERPAVIITLPGRLAYGDVSVEHRDILILPDARQMTYGDALEGLKRAFRAHVIALLPWDAKPSASEWDALRCWYGLQECVVPAHGRRRLPVDVASMAFEAKPRAGLDASPLEIKRQEIWTHPIRNRLLSQCAQRLRTGESPQGLPLNELAPGPQRVALLVESVEHAAELLKGLPQWPLIASDTANLNGLRKCHASRIKTARSLVPYGCVIVTHAAAVSVDFGKFDVLLRADAGTGLPAGLQQTSTDGQDQRRPLLLIDLADRHHPVCRQWSRTRRDKYAQAGWYAPYADPMDERCKQFLASR
jgi:hypothetical protein